MNAQTAVYTDHSQSKKIVVFTVHKAASMFLHKVLSHLVALTGLSYYSPNNHENPALNTFSFPVTKKNNDPAYARFFLDKTGCIGPVRRPVILADFKTYDIVLHLRDPRDGLTSMFFSYSYSHPGIDDAERQSWIAQGIDRFVKDRAADYFERYAYYCQNFISKDNVTVVTYEEMITNFPAWLQKFTAPFPLANRQATMLHLLDTYRDEFTIDTENAMNHKRRITPGDHRNKLQPETIAFLNSTYGDILHRLGYS